MFDARITDNHGTRVEVTDNGELITAISPNPPEESPILTVPFMIALTLIDEVTTNANVIGTLENPIEFAIRARSDGDLYITTLSVVISSSNLQLNRFGGISGGLTNGIQIFYQSPSAVAISPLEIKTNFDFIRFGTMTMPTGGKADAFQITNAFTTNEDAIAPLVDLTRFGAHSYGVRLRNKSNDKFGFLIRDNLTSITIFSVIAMGFRRIIE